VQPEVGAAAFIGNGKTVAADPELVSSNNGKTDTSRSDDDDAAVASAVRADAGDGRVVNIGNRAEWMRVPLELLEQALASDTGKPDRGMHGGKRASAKAGILGRGATGFFNFGKGAIHSDTQRRRTGNAAPKQGSFGILDPCAAAGAAAVDTDEKQSGFGGRRHSAIRWISAPHCMSLRSSDS